MGRTVSVGGPYFEDLEVGQRFDDAPAVTITDGLAAVYQALCGDRLRLPLDRHLSTAVTGRDQPLANPMLALHIGLGPTTLATQRVLGNLFYRNMQFFRPVYVGDTLRTVTEVVGLRQNQPKPGRPATGMAALRMTVDNQDGERILDFWRCPMLPLRDPEAITGRADSFDSIPNDLDLAALVARVKEWGWNLGAFARALGTGGLRLADLEPGTTYAVEARDSVTCAPEMARMMLNLAYTHIDPNAGAHPGRRLVYGGHTFSVASAQVTKALGNLVTILAWRAADHTGPVFEGDVLRTEVTVEGVHPGGDGGLVDLRAVVYAERAADAAARTDGAPEESPVLDWRFIALAV